MMEPRRMKVKVCLVGEHAVGKTSLIKRYVLNEYDDRYIVTLGAKVSKKELALNPKGGDAIQMDMTIWDIMGSKGFRELLREAYFHGAQGILAVADTARSSPGPVLQKRVRLEWPTAIASSSRPILRPSVSGPGPGSASVRVRVTRDLGLFDITMAALGAMVGAAIFLLVGAAYAVAGPLVLLSLAVAALVAALAAIAHFARVHLPVRALGRLTLGKILLIVLVAVLGAISVFQPGPPRGFAVGAPVSSLDLMLGAGVLFIAFQGFEVVAQLSDQVKHPESSVPRGVFLALLLAFLVYGGFFLAVLGSVPSDKLSGWPGCAACFGGSEDMVLSGVRHFVGQPYVRVIVLIIGIVSMYGALNSNLTAAIKTSFSMARDRLLPGSFARIGGREVPPAAVALTFVGAGFLVFLTIETIAILASLAFLGLFAFVHASVVALRRGERRSAPGFRVPLVPAVPMAAIALNPAVGALLWN